MIRHNMIWIRPFPFSPDDSTEIFLAEINATSVVTRYPDDFERMQKDFSKERVKQILEKSQEVFRWIKTFVGS